MKNSHEKEIAELKTTVAHLESLNRQITATNRRLKEMKDEWLQERKTLQARFVETGQEGREMRAALIEQRNTLSNRVTELERQNRELENALATEKKGREADRVLSQGTIDGLNYRVGNSEGGKVGFQEGAAFMFDKMSVLLPPQQ